MSDQTYGSYRNDQNPLLKHFRKELRRLRQKHGWTQQVLAANLKGWTEDTVSNIELGRRPPTLKFAQAVDRVFDTGDAYEQLVRGAVVDDGSAVFLDWLDVEHGATALKVWDLANIPGLLQTKAYALATFKAWQVIDGLSDPEHEVAERMERQAIFTRQPSPSYTAIIGDYALRRPVGGPNAMRGQLEHLLEMSRHPRVTVQILPTSTGAHVGGLGAFEIASLPDGEPITLYAETATGQGHATAHPAMTERAMEIFDALRADALNAQASRETIERTLEEEQWPE